MQSLAIGTLLLLAPAAGAQRTLWVDAAAGPGGDGSAQSPFDAVQDGLDAAADGDTVRVLAGTYVENVDFLGKDVLVEAAGAPGTAVIDGGGGGPCVTVDGTDHGPGALQALTGFTLRSGVGAPVSFGDAGGGLLVRGASPRIADCVVEACTAEFGGGMAFLNSKSRVERCDVRSNDGVWGGGIYGGREGLLGGAAVVVTDSDVHDNRSPQAFFCGLGEGGGALFDANSAGSRLERCNVYSNLTVTRGGGVSGGTLLQCNVWDNEAAEGGGVHGVVATFCRIYQNRAISCDLSFNAGAGAHQSTLTSCEIEDNAAWDFGGGAAACTLVDCRLLRNLVVTTPDVGPAQGGGAWSSTLSGCTVAFNRVTASPGEGGGVHGSSTTRTLIYENEADFAAGAFGGTHQNAVVYGNLGEGVAFAGGLFDSVVRQNAGAELVGGFQVAWCNVEGGPGGPSNFDAPALFWAPAGGGNGSGGHDFHLMAGSPNVDAGNPANPPDPDGSVADVGVFPYDPAWVPVPAVYCTSTASAAGCAGAVAATGTASVSGGSLAVDAAGVPSRANGLLFYGQGAAAVPLLGGTLCVQPPLGRTAIQYSAGTGACGGAFTFTFDPAFFAASPFLGAGDFVYAQYWSRDPAGPPGGAPAFTDAVWFAVLP